MRASSSVGTAVCLCLLAGCAAESDRVGTADTVEPDSSTQAEVAVDSLGADSVDMAEAAEPADPLPLKQAPAQIRGLYLNAHAAGSSTRLPQMIDIARRTEINTFVIDLKDELGIQYRSDIPVVREFFDVDEAPIRDLAELASRLDAEGIFTIGRIVTFNDPMLSAERPEWSIRNPDGDVWLDRSGNSWVSPWDERVWEYNLAIAEEAARAGFDAIQFDYVRFPEQFQSLPEQVHPRANGTRSDAIATFLTLARDRLHPLGVTIEADVFGLSPNTYTDVGIGQQWERLSTIVDRILPMMYPSHYYSTHLPNVAQPNAMPYETIYKAAGMARLRRDRIREAGGDPARVVVWLQAFQAPWLGDGIEYGAEELRLQKEGLYDVGLDEWVLWHPGSRYNPFLEALEAEAGPRGIENYDPPADVLRQVERFEELGIAGVRSEAVATQRGD